MFHKNIGMITKMSCKCLKQRVSKIFWKLEIDSNLFAPVAQWIEQWFPVPCAGVRFPSGVFARNWGCSGAL